MELCSFYLPLPDFVTIFVDGPISFWILLDSHLDLTVSNGLNHKTRGEPGIFKFFFIYTLNCSFLDQSTIAPPWFYFCDTHSAEFKVHQKFLEWMKMYLWLGLVLQINARLQRV